MVEKREEELEPWKRTARQYTKRDTRFWHEGGKQESARKFPRLAVSTEQDVNQQTSTQMPSIQYSERELKSLKVPQLCDILEVKLGLSVGSKRKLELIEMIRQFLPRSQ